MPLADMVAPRKAALLLHSIPQADRQAVLGRLSIDERLKLEGLIAELEALDLPPGGHWSALLKDADAGASGDSLARVRALSAAQVIAALGGQPVEVSAAVVGGCDWPWREAVIAAWPVQESARLERLLRDQQRLSEAALRVLATRLIDQPAVKALALSAPPQALATSSSRKSSWLRRLF